MPLSVLTGLNQYQIAERSFGTPGLWNAPLLATDNNFTQLNTDASALSQVVSNISTNLAGWNAGSISTILNTSAGTLVIGSGTALNPSIAFSSETSLGWYRSAASHMDLSYGQLSVPGGAVTLPTYTFVSNRSTGIIDNGTPGLDVVVAGTVAGRGLTNQWLTVSGSAVLPTKAFTSEISLGFYRSGASVIAQSYGTLQVPVLSTNSLMPQSGNTIGVYSQLSLNNTVLTGLATPSNASDGVPKTYADALLSGGVSSFRGDWTTGISAVTLSAGSFCFFTSTSSVSMADSTNSVKAPLANLFVALAASNASSTVTLGIAGDVGLYTSLTTGATYFLNTTGGPTTTAPSAQSTIVYAVGVAKSAQTIVFAPTYLGSNAT